MFLHLLAQSEDRLIPRECVHRKRINDLANFSFFTCDLGSLWQCHRSSRNQVRCPFFRNVSPLQGSYKLMGHRHFSQPRILWTEGQERKVGLKIGQRGTGFRRIYQWGKFKLINYLMPEFLHGPCNTVYLQDKKEIKFWFINDHLSRLGMERLQSSLHSNLPPWKTFRWGYVLWQINCQNVSNLRWKMKCNT